MGPEFPRQADSIPKVVAHLARKRQWRRGAWVGAGDARDVAHMLSLRLNLHLTVVESWSPAHPDAPHTFDYAAQERAARARLKPFSRRLRIVKGQTLDALARLDPDTLDFVVLDPDRHLCTEIRQWSPMLVDGGWFVSSASGRPGVRAAMEETMPAYGLGPAGTWFGPKWRD